MLTVIWLYSVHLSSSCGYALDNIEGLSGIKVLFLDVSGHFKVGERKQKNMAE